MITRAKFENFKALRNVEITFDSRLTVLVGPNGSGKTSVLQGMHALSQVAVISGNDPDVALPKMADFLSIGLPKGDLSLRVEGSRPMSGGYSIVLDTAQPGLMNGILLTDTGETRRQWRVQSNYINGLWQNPRVNASSTTVGVAS